MKKNMFWVPFDGNLKKLLLTMKLTLLILLLSAASLLASSGYSQNTTLSVKLKNCTMKELIKEIENQSEFIFFYYDDVIDLDRRVTVNMTNQTVDKILDTVFESTNNTYKIYDRQITIGKKDPVTNELISITEGETSAAQKRKLTGTVTDPDGDPIPGVTVVVKGKTIGTITDPDGNFNLQIPEDSEALIFSFVGYTSQEVTINSQTNFNIQLKEATLGVDEVIVVGYGSQKKETVTGSVSVMDTKALIQSPQANISNAMVGRMTGLLSVQRQGQPGEDQAILRIRGEGTFSGSSDPLVLVDGIESLNFNNIDPNEIENISILKDASATAVFGVRGANGVILITTKRGEQGSPVLSVSSNVAVATFTDVRENLESYEYAQYFNEALRYNSYTIGAYTPKFTEEDIEHYRIGDDPIFHPSTDWLDLMLKPTSIQTQHNVNIRGGSDLIKYFISAGYFSQSGMFDNTEAADGYDAQIKYKRYNFRSNFDFSITRRLSANINISSQIDNIKGPEENIGFLFNRISIAPPYNSPGLVDGKIVNVYDVFGGNPLELLLSTGIHNELINYLTSSVRLNYDLSEITNGLTLHGTISTWNKMSNSKIYPKSTQTYRPLLLPDDSILYAPQKEDTPFGFKEETSKNRKTYFEVGLNYEREFGDHGITGLILYNQDKLYDPALDYVIPNGHQGIVGRLTYNYKKRYLAEFNVGYNGTENFAPGKRFGFFPAYSLGWVLTEESFYPKNKVLTYMKIRGSYGEVGNDKIGGDRFLYRPSSYTYADDSNPNNASYYYGVPGTTFQGYFSSSEGIIGNPDLTWERAKKSNIGMDMTLWGNKIRIVADLFEEDRDNILATPQTTPDIVGITLPAQNWGRMKNSGYEAEINFVDHIGKVRYWLKGNYTYAHNEILYQDEVTRPLSYQYRTGQSKNQMFGYIVEGFYNTWEEVNDVNRPVSSHQNNKIMPGDLRYKDINGDGIINVNDQVPIGYPEFPEIIYGLSFGIDYKGFDVSILFQGAEHVSRRNVTTTIRPFENDLFALAYIPDYAWAPEKYANGETIKLPHLSAQQIQEHDYQMSTFMVQDASYLRLKNAEIGYRFSGSSLKRMNISSLRLYVNCNNLITWDGLFPGDDPEQLAISGNSGYYPLTRTVNLGFNVEF